MPTVEETEDYYEVMTRRLTDAEAIPMLEWLIERRCQEEFTDFVYDREIVGGIRQLLERTRQSSDESSVTWTLKFPKEYIEDATLFKLLWT